MAVELSNELAANFPPNTNHESVQFTVPSGTDRTLLVVITMPNNRNYTTATYDGVAMTQIYNNNFGGLGQRQAAYILQNPNVGTNQTVRVNFSGTQTNVTSIYCAVFNNAGGLDNFAVNGAQSTPNNKSLTVQQDSRIYATGISIFAQNSNYTINGSNRGPRFNGHNTGTNIVEGALSATDLPAGSISVITKADANSITNCRIAILAAGGGPVPPTRRRRINVT